jgi:flagellar biosynthesis/type III secretory pathway protein FliH
LKNLVSFEDIPSILCEPVFEKAFKLAEYHNMTLLEQNFYQTELKSARDRKNEIFTSRYEGKEEGFAEGLMEGEIKGKAEGLTEGEAKGKRSSIFTILELRFKGVPANVVQAIESCDDLGKLELLLKRATDSGNLAEFEKYLAEFV